MLNDTGDRLSRKYIIAINKIYREKFRTREERWSERDKDMSESFAEGNGISARNGLYSKGCAIR